MVGQPGQRRLVGSATPSAGLLSELPSWVRLVRAPNPGPMTLEGTNTWVLRVPGADACVVVDPGPLDEAHLDAVARLAAAEAVTVITTHFHADHTGGVEHFLRICPSARLRDARDPANLPEVAMAGIDLTILATPGHTADSVTVIAGAGNERAVFTGDTILGRGTTIVAHPDGDLGDYLDSLRRLEQVGALPVLPGHGPALADCAVAARHYLEHRLTRLEQVRAARAAGATSAADVVRVVYADVDASLWPAAQWSVRAQLAYLDKERSDLDKERPDGESTRTPAELDRP